MLPPAILLSLSLLTSFLALYYPAWSDLLLLSLPAVIASALLLLAAVIRKRKTGSPPKWIIIDGSNVMYWRNNTPKLDTVREVLRLLMRQGYTVGIMFDANAGYLLSDRYIHDGKMGKLLGLPKDQIMVVPKGTPADPYILQAARDFDAPIVTNDQFKDWSNDFPEVRTPGHLIKGQYQGAKLSLDLAKQHKSPS